MTDLKKQLEHELAQAEIKAWDSLSRYKFMMFGYHAACWVKINRMGEFKRKNPFIELVRLSREQKLLAEGVAESDRRYQAGYEDASMFTPERDGDVHYRRGYHDGLQAYTNYDREED